MPADQIAAAVLAQTEQPVASPSDPAPAQPQLKPAPLGYAFEGIPFAIVGPAHEDYLEEL